MGFLAGKKTTNFNWGNFLKFDHEICCPVSCLYPVKNPSVKYLPVELIALKNIIMS